MANSSQDRGRGRMKEQQLQQVSPPPTSSIPASVTVILPEVSPINSREEMKALDAPLRLPKYNSLNFLSVPDNSFLLGPSQVCLPTEDSPFSWQVVHKTTLRWPKPSGSLRISSSLSGGSTSMLL